MSRTVIAIIAALVVAFVLVEASLFQVDQTEQVLITQFGDPIRVIRQPGLHAKTPFVQTDQLRQAAAQPGTAGRAGDPGRPATAGGR
jgi:regulator of protease activity HflC (stomatin/prohibitin superfamily)